MRFRRHLAHVGLLLSLTTLSMRADLIGSSVTGAFTDGASAVNLFDPTVATNVIPAGSQNLQGTTVVIEPGQLQFGTELGCFISCNLITATFTATQLDIHTHAGFSFGLFGFPDTFHFTFTDPAFSGISEESNTFQTSTLFNTLQTSPLNFGLAGHSISIDIGVSAFAGQDYDAVFDLSSAPTSPALPESSSLLSLAAVLGAVLSAGRRAKLIYSKQPSRASSN
ncbi:MAG TPA: hypothetical protein VKT49_21495 [Bryobacteraceae bacterium]|nr:hypothetical protein [Bryobacteraceae bacterium]